MKCYCDPMEKLAGRLCETCIQRIEKEVYGDPKRIGHEVGKIKEARRKYEKR